jgi:hypothetical protein
MFLADLSLQHQPVDGNLTSDTAVSLSRICLVHGLQREARQIEMRGGGVAVLTATCLLVSSLSRFPIAVVSSMIDPFIVFPLCGALR